MKKGKFSLGQTVCTPSVLESIEMLDVLICLQRHRAGDWGDCGPEDSEENESSLEHGGFRLLSVYHDRRGVKFWIITEADRSATTVLLPEDY